MKLNIMRRLADHLFGSTLTAPPTAKHQWRTLPGSVIELMGHGFQVKLNTDLRAPPFIAYDPDGRLIASGTDLGAIKDYLEQCEDWRREFDPPDGGWKLP